VTYERYMVIGDVHGCLDELDELLKVVQYRHGDKDCLVFAGDLVDRGPDPVGSVRRARELGASCAMGNHEEKHIRWRNWESRIKAGEAKKNPMRRFDEQRMREHEALSDDDIAYLMAMPKTVSLGHEKPSWVVVHAGFECNEVPYWEQARDTVCRVRDVDPVTGKMASNSKNPLESVPGSVPWGTRWKGPENVVYGHAVHSREVPRVDLHDGYGCYGIDTGCVFGGRLTALVLANRTAPVFAQVAAKREYYPWSRNNAGND
jgi:bis(5'-nucleosyl)-tetraphosphatase (symmetrical)